MRPTTFDHLKTLAVHAGEPEPRIADAVSMPVFLSSTYDLGEPESFDDIRYIRLNNTPNHEALAGKIAALEDTEDAVVTSSGTAAISMSLLCLLRPGDHVIAQDRLYGGTSKVMEGLLQERGVAVTMVPGDEPARWKTALREETKVIYFESITNPLMQVGDLEAAARFGREHGLVSIIDNTFTSPINFRPAHVGFDLVIHSASKYLNGHTDVVAGAVAGKKRLVQAVRKTMNLAGVCLDPHACYLLQRGIKTLPLRVRAQNETALALAKFLDEHREVEEVRYPGLPGDPSHTRAEALFAGYGAMLSFVPRGGKERAERLMHNLRYARIAPSLGGVETLICRPATTSHAGFDAETRLKAGVPDDMVRVSVGIEGAEDLLRDFERALENS